MWVPVAPAAFSAPLSGMAAEKRHAITVAPGAVGGWLRKSIVTDHVGVQLLITAVAMPRGSRLGSPISNIIAKLMTESPHAGWRCLGII